MARKKADLPTQEIPTSKFEVTEFDDLNAYLDDDFNHEVYMSRQRATRDFPEFDDAFELSFFKAFYRALSFVKTHLNQPAIINTKLQYAGTDIRRTLMWYADELDSPILRDSRALLQIREMENVSIEELSKNVFALADLLKRKNGLEQPGAEASISSKVKKARRRDIPKDRIGLFFYYLFQATNSTGTRDDKAKVVSLLTQFGESTIKGMLSNPLANEDKDGFDDDFKAVMTMFRLIGFSDAFELMKRDRKKE